MDRNVKHPCNGCVYFNACGDSLRTTPCKGRQTKKEKKSSKKVGKS